MPDAAFGKRLSSCENWRQPQLLAEASVMKENRLYFPLRVEGHFFSALIDTGAIRSFVGKTVMNTFPDSIRPSLCEQVRVANGEPVLIPGEMTLNLGTAEDPWIHTFLCMECLMGDAIIGMDFLRKFPSVARELADALQPRKEEQTDQTGGHNCTIEAVENKDDLSKDQTKKLEEFLAEELPVFETIRRPTKLVKHQIRLKDPTPLKQRYRNRNPKMQEIIDAEVDEMLAAGVIERSHSPWSSPVVLVTKKDGKKRFCIDFRAINKVSEKDAYPLPKINAILDKLREGKYFSTLDLKSGYWQVPLTADSKPVTAFTAPERGLFQFRVMPFGLHSAPATFQRLLDQIIGPELDKCAFVYLDDIIVIGRSFEEHLLNLRKVFRQLYNASLKLNPSKCHFGKRKLKYLGHLVTADGIQTDPDKVKAIQAIPQPKTTKQVRSFLGVATWYRRFVPNFADIAAPLCSLLKKDTRFHWGASQQEAFAELRKRLTEAPVLACPDFARQFTLQTDASDVGIGLALTQEFDDGEHVIAYASRTLTPQEQKFHTTEKECLAIVWGIEQMRPYLEGYHFKVMTDHHSLKWLQSLKEPKGRRSRWVMLLQMLFLDIRCLSRKAQPENCARRQHLFHASGIGATWTRCRKIRNQCQTTGSKMVSSSDMFIILVTWLNRIC